jgi:precorrin-6A/cobalt-precorrin-6A reductase
MQAQSLLILGGTAEAAALAGAALDRFGGAIGVVTSLAGRTRRPGPLPGEVRIGGFGGAPGLAAHLAEHGIDRLIDATHPFAAHISRAARLACATAGVPRLMLQRPPWQRHPDDRWIEVDHMAEAAEVVGHMARRAWLTIGAGEIAAFSPLTSVHFLVRLVEPPRQALPLRHCEVILGRGPFGLDEERRRLQQHAIEVLVCKAAGGGATEAKLVAARELAVPVVMLRRPPAEPGASVETVAAALDWLAAPASERATESRATGKQPTGSQAEGRVP